MKKEASFTLRNDLADLERLKEILEHFADHAGLSPKVLFELNLSLEELITNVIHYSYDDKQEHIIEITISKEGDEIAVVIEDDGNPFNPLEAPEPDLDQPLEEKRIGGLGIHLVLKLTDKLEYKRKDNRNIVSLKKRIN